MSTFWKTFLLSAAAAGVLAAAYAWTRYDLEYGESLKSTLPQFMKMDWENITEEQIEALMDELAGQL